MSKKSRYPVIPDAASEAAGLTERRRQEDLLKAGVLQDAILNSANFSSIATDENGVIQIFNVGAEHMLGYAAGDVVNKITPADISDAQELIARAQALSLELATAIKPGFEALVFKASRGIEDIYELTYIRKDGSRFPALVSVTALYDAAKTIIGYLLIGTDNTARKKIEAEKQQLLEIQEQSSKQLQQSHAALQISEENLAVTLNSIGDAVMTTDGEGRITLLNPLAQQLTGWTQAEAVGHPVAEIFNIIDQNTRQASLILPLMETLKNGTPFSMSDPALLIARNGSEHLISDSCAPICARDGRVTGAVLVFRNVREEYTALQALQDSTALVQTILNTVADGIITLHAQSGIVETVNFAAENMFGYAAAEMTGQSIRMLIPELGHDFGPAMLESYQTLAAIRTPGVGQGQQRHEVMGQRKDGSVFPMDIEVSEMWQSGQRYFIGVLRDITLLKQVEAEREQLDKRLTDQQAYNQSLIESNIDALFNAARDITERRRLDRVLQYKNTELEIAKAAAEKANLAKSDFLSKMSHELRTPLNAILGFAQLLESGSPPPTDGQAIRLQQIIKAGWYLLSLINEILDLAVIESGKLSLSQEMVPLQEILHECQTLIETDAQKRDVHLDFIPCDPTWLVFADRMRLKQVLLNLLSNAVKYNRKHGTIQVRCSTHGERIRISITDSGSGLAPEKLAQLFQPFNRLGQQTGTTEGTGIGLVVAKQLVELMGGTIGVNSTVGVGSEFWVELIWDVSAQLPDEQALPPQQHFVEEGGSTLLYVEDNPANLLLVEHILQHHPKLRLLSASDGALGVALARAHLPDVILMDIDLPGISGIEALAMLRHEPATAHIPVLAVSANAMPGDIEKGLADGFFRYLTEPIKVNDFMNALGEALKYSAAEKELVNVNEMGKL